MSRLNFALLFGQPARQPHVLNQPNIVRFDFSRSFRLHAVVARFCNGLNAYRQKQSGRDVQTDRLSFHWSLTLFLRWDILA